MPTENPTSRLRRRGLLARFGLAVVGIESLRRGTAAASEPERSVERLRRALQVDVRSARAIARCHFGAVPAGAAASALARELLEAAPDLAAAVPSLSDSALRETVQQRIRSDFALGQTVVVEGWVLSRTEVLLCAAVA